MSFFAELKGRNVIKVAAAYIIVGWLIMQAGEVMAPALNLPAWVNSTLVFFLILGLPVAIIFAWAFEMTPDGLKRGKDVDRSQSITSQTSRKLDSVIIDRDVAEIEAAVQIAQEDSAQEEEPAADNSVAVLPFVNMSSDEEQEYFSDGLSEELLNLLTKIPELRVAARTSSFSFKGQNIEVPEIASRLGVAYILEGSVRKSGNQVRITAQLIKADDGFHLWSETYDRTLKNIFQIQDEIAGAVVESLKIKLLGDAPGVWETDPQAYQHFLEAQFLRHQVTLDSLTKAVDLYKKAVEIDPGYAPAWAELAYTYVWLGLEGAIPIDEGSALANQAIESALSIDPDNAFAYFARGAMNVFNKFNFKSGIADFQHALQLDPGNAFLIGANGNGARATGRFDEAIKLFLAALELDPVIPQAHFYLARTYHNAGRLDNAEACFRKVLKLVPGYPGAHFNLGLVLISKGELSEAMAEMNKDANPVLGSTGLAMIHHALGNTEESQLALDELIENNAETASYQVAQVYGFRGETDQVFEWLERSYAIHDKGLSSMLGDPTLRGLITDPRWQLILEKVGLLEAWLAMPPEWGGP